MGLMTIKLITAETTQQGGGAIKKEELLFSDHIEEPVLGASVQNCLSQRHRYGRASDSPRSRRSPTTRC